VRSLRKKEKEDRLRRNRELRAQGIDPGADEDLELGAAEPLPEVRLEDVVIGVVSQPRRAAFGPCKLFVGGLGADTTTEDLRAAFVKYGNIVDVAVVPDRATGRSRGFGFVTFDSWTDADEAIKKMNGTNLDGHAIKVNRAEVR
jgi:RNA recognition motif-containing protein